MTHAASVELIEERVGACGCPEEVWLIDGLEVTMHFESEGEDQWADVFVDAGDWDVENRHTGSRDRARADAIAFILSWPVEGSS